MLKPERLTQPPERESCLQQDEGCPQSNIDLPANRLLKIHADAGEEVEGIDLREETAVRVVHIGVAVANLDKNIAGSVEEKKGRVRRLNLRTGCRDKSRFEPDGNCCGICARRT